MEAESIHQEKESSASERRPVLDHLLGVVLTAGETLVMTYPDRLSRRTAAIILTRGRYLGRPVTVTPWQHEAVLMLCGVGKFYLQVVAATGVSPSTVARICREEAPGHRRYRKQQEAYPVLGDSAAPSSTWVRNSVDQ